MPKHTKRTPETDEKYARDMVQKFKKTPEHRRLSQSYDKLRAKGEREHIKEVKATFFSSIKDEVPNPRHRNLLWRVVNKGEKPNSTEETTVFAKLNKKMILEKKPELFFQSLFSKMNLAEETVRRAEITRMYERTQRNSVASAHEEKKPKPKPRT